jgi:HEAT repeat protein
MTDSILDAERWAFVAARLGLALAMGMLVMVIVERMVFAYAETFHRRFARQYQPLLARALEGDDGARRTLVEAPRRHQVALARLLITPLIDDRDPQRISRTRNLLRELPLVGLADRLLHSRHWWQRALALRTFGLIQSRIRTPAIVAALDDPNPQVRAAALDALTDMEDPASLPAVVVRVLDTSLHRGRRAAVLAAFGCRCEPFLLDMAELDAEHRDSYARALGICGTSRARPSLCQWTTDSRLNVRAAAFEALGHVGLDDHAAQLAVDALESPDESVRAMAAYALHDWHGSNDAAVHLTRHLDDVWMVAMAAARSLRTMGGSGLDQLRAAASRPGSAGALARQMLWEADAAC